MKDGAGPGDGGVAYESRKLKWSTELLPGLKLLRDGEASSPACLSAVTTKGNDGVALCVAF